MSEFACLVMSNAAAAGAGAPVVGALGACPPGRGPA